MDFNDWFTELICKCQTQHQEGVQKLKWQHFRSGWKLIFPILDDCFHVYITLNYRVSGVLWNWDSSWLGSWLLLQHSYLLDTGQPSIAIIDPSSGKKDIVQISLLPLGTAGETLYASMKHQRPYPRAHLQSVFCNWNSELLSSLITGEPSHASLCPFLIILLVIKTCWQAKLLNWVGAPLINLSSFPGTLCYFLLLLCRRKV